MASFRRCDATNCDRAGRTGAVGWSLRDVVTCSGDSLSVGLWESAMLNEYS